MVSGFRGFRLTRGAVPRSNKICKLQKQKYKYGKSRTFEPFIMHSSIWSYIWEGHKSGTKTWALLLDPDKAPLTQWEGLLASAERNGCSLILLGTSMQESGRSGQQIIADIRAVSALPVVLFPGPGNPVLQEADALLFLSLVSGRNPEFLIGQQVQAAPKVRQTGLETIATAYQLVDGGKTTTAHYVSQTLPVPADKPGIAAATALAAHYMGMKLHYLDAGSGALNPVPPNLIQAIKSLNLGPLWVGGGIRRPNQVQEAWQAGADLVVIGQALEENPNHMAQLFEGLSPQSWL
jgi:putative glycerol-1-phosphate prenyltransferase